MLIGLLYCFVMLCLYLCDVLFCVFGLVCVLLYVLVCICCLRFDCFCYDLSIVFCFELVGYDGFWLHFVLFVGSFAFFLFCLC